MELPNGSNSENSDQLADLQQKQEDEDDDDDETSEKKAKVTTAATTNKIDTTYYDYLINMSLRNLTKERRNDILKEQQDKHEKLEDLERKAPEDLYDEDISNFETEYHKVNSHLGKLRSIDFIVRLWKKNVLMKCLKSLIIPRKKWEITLVERNKQRNHNVQKPDLHHMVNELLQRLIQLFSKK